MILTKEVEKKDFYREYYRAINGLLNLTNREIDVLSEFSYIKNSLPDSYTESQKDEYLFSSTTRGIISEKLGISTFNLNNSIKSLRDKGVFIKSDKKTYTINKFLFTRVNTEDVEFKLLFKIKQHV